MQMEDTTIGWRFINPQMKALYGVHSMPETAENVADEFAILFIAAKPQRLAFALRHLDGDQLIGEASCLLGRGGKIPPSAGALLTRR
jgi:hypothetical protein